tara:strand:+ start:2077 stop:2301 length:225 start_codon:yes stop_codon:yes gene_type:complete
MSDRMITITVCDNGYYLDGAEGSVVFSDGPDEVPMNDYSPSLRLLINHLLHLELMEDNGNKYGKQLFLTEKDDD